MPSIKQIEFENIIRRINDFGYGSSSLYHDKIIILDMDGKQAEAYNQRNNSLFPPLKLDAFIIVMVEKGEFIINIDYRPFHVTANTAVFLSEKHIVQFVSTSSDLRCFCKISASDFTRSMVKDIKLPVSDFSAISFFFNPLIQLKLEEFALLRGNMERLQRNIHRSDHIFWKELVQNELTNLLFETFNILMLKLGNEPEKQKNTRREQVIFRFFQLLFEYSRTEREVIFYADKLYVTPVYLSRLIKRTVGKSAIKIIHEMVISDALVLLRRPDMTIQDTSDIMNFPDRETFSKFFKNVAGETPGEYRKKVKEEK